MLPICTQVSSYYTCCNYHHRLCNIRYMFNLLVILRLVATGLLSQYTQQTAPTADRTGSNGGSTVHLSPSKGGPKVPLQHLEQTALFPIALTVVISLYTVWNVVQKSRHLCWNYPSYLLDWSTSNQNWLVSYGAS